MKRKPTMLLAAALLTLTAAASAQELPSNALFSPGLAAMSETLGAGGGLAVTAQFTADEALYARDISIFSDMLSGAAFAYEGAPGYDALTIARGGETLLDLALWESESGAVAAINGEGYALDEAQLSSETIAAFRRADEFLLGTPILERAPLADVAAWIAGLETGDELIAGWRVTLPFSIERTMSDDGTRLTRIDIDGAVADPGGGGWSVSGHLRQPAGRAPKDTFEIEIRQDEQNFIQLSYSALRENEIIRKNKEGETKVSSSVKAAGEIGGYAVSARLIVNAANHWKTAGEGEPLTENITLRTTVGYTDRNPASAKCNRDDLAATMRHELRVVTAEGDANVSVTDEASAEITTGGEGLLAGTMVLAASAGPDAPGEADQAPEGEAATLEDIGDALGRAVRSMSAALHAQLGDAYREKIAP